MLLTDKSLMFFMVMLGDWWLGMNFPKATDFAILENVMNGMKRKLFKQENVLLYTMYSVFYF